MIYQTGSAVDLGAMVLHLEERIWELERRLTNYERKDEDQDKDKEPDMHGGGGEGRAT